MATNSSVLAWRIPMDRGAWQAAVHDVAKSWTQLTKHTTQQANTIQMCVFSTSNMGGSSSLLLLLLIMAKHRQVFCTLTS